MYCFLLVIAMNLLPLIINLTKLHAMKRFSILLFSIISVISCTNNQKLTFKNIEIFSNGCDTCAAIEINIPEAQTTSAIATRINTNITETVIETINFSEEETPLTIEDAIESFTSEYKKLATEFPESSKWEVTIDGTIISENKNMICVQLESYLFTGGAHGYRSTSYLNFNLRSGGKLTISDLFKDVDVFKLMAEKIFRKQENIPPEANINSTGFMFENDEFNLPETIGFSEKELILLYNQYEIASYADGQKIIKIPLFQVSNMLKL